MAMDWTDLIPGVGLAKMGKKSFFDDPANAQKAGYDQASQQTGVNQQKLMDFYMGQQARAQGFYKPLQSMFQSAYGTQGLQAPQLPGKPLRSMYGGGQ